jgi:hypothetical protein
MKTSLLAALRVVARADSDPMRTVLFESLARRHARVRLVRWLTHRALRGRWPAALAVSAYAFLTARVCLVPPRTPVWALPLFENDRVQIERVAAWIGAARVGRSGGGWPRAVAATRLLARALRNGTAWRFVRTSRRLCRRHEFLASCRTASALACAMVANDTLPRSGAKAVFVSSDYNAEAVGLVSSARSAGRATIFVSHAPPHRLSPPLDFTLAVLDGEAQLAVYRAKGPVRARVVFKGVSGAERPLDVEAFSRSHPRIGVFLPKEVDGTALRRVVREAQDRFAPARVLVRWHPNALTRPPLDRVLEDVAGVEALPAGAPLDEDARVCHWVLADRNSSVALSVLKAGVPVAMISGLAVFPEEEADLYGLARDKIVPPACVSLHELVPADLARFYDGDWRERFRRHDGRYGQPAGSAEREVAQAVLDLLGPEGRA